jgi:lipopolysaccharide/colanic/teichoic acid biosynthesis glycosyltransferase
VKRVFDIISSAMVLIIGLPFFLVITLLIVFTSQGGVFFKQKRVGKNGVEFWLYKFRTMKPDSESKGLITVGGRDQRITGVGYFLRKFKLDEFPQLINVIKGDMSIVGPRPEVRKYVEMYSAEQRKVLTVRPGLTDLASIQYINENELLGKSNNAEKTYVEEVMPAKLALNLQYIQQKSFWFDMKLILKTIGSIVK